MQAFTPPALTPQQAASISAACCKRMQERAQAAQQSNVKARLEWEHELQALQAAQLAKPDNNNNDSIIPNKAAAEVLQARTARILSTEPTLQNTQPNHAALYAQRMQQYTTTANPGVDGEEQGKGKQGALFNLFRNPFAKEEEKKKDATNKPNAITVGNINQLQQPQHQFQNITIQTPSSSTPQSNNIQVERPSLIDAIVSLWNKWRQTQQQQQPSKPEETLPYNPAIAK